MLKLSDRIWLVCKRVYANKKQDVTQIDDRRTVEMQDGNCGASDRGEADKLSAFFVPRKML